MTDDNYLEEEQSTRQPPWFLLTGLVLGLGIGLLISMLITPVRYTETAPATLSREYQDRYRWLIARAYQANGDLIRAQQRLALLADVNPHEALVAQAQQMLAEGKSVENARALADLASALSSAAKQPVETPVASSTATVSLDTQQPVATLDMSAAVQTATSPAATQTLMPTSTQRGELTALPTLGLPFALNNRQEVCDPSLTPGLLQIELTDQAGQPVAGIQIHVAWNAGLDTFYTGLKPSISPGYADFVMSAGVVYSLRVGSSNETIKDLTAPQCQGDGGGYLGGLRLEFSQR